jgi:hypothetical protein
MNDDDEMTVAKFEMALTPFGRHLVRKVVHNGKYVPEVHARV